MKHTIKRLRIERKKILAKESWKEVKKKEKK